MSAPTRPDKVPDRPGGPRTQAEAVERLLRESPLDLGGELAVQRPLLDHVMSRRIPQGVAMADDTVNGVGILEVRTDGVADHQMLFHLHGGAYAMGSARASAGLLAELAGRAGVRGVGVDYQLAPEHPFPAALDDAVAAYRGLLESGVGAGDVVVSGESAGGGLALALLVSLRDEGLPQPAAAVVLSPWADLTMSGGTITTKSAADPAVTVEALRVRAADYAGGHDATDPYVSPVFADFTGLPPLLVQAGSDEILLDDAVRVAGRAASDDVAVTLQVTPGVPHVFQEFAATLGQAARALDAAAAFAREHLGPAT